MNFTDSKGAFCQGACFVKDHHLRMGQGFQVVAPLNQNTDFGGTADTAKETKRNGDHQCAGAGNNQEGQCPVNPYAKRLLQENRRQDCQGQSSKYNDWRIVSGKPADKVFCPAFFVACIFHQVKYFGDCGFSKFLCGLYGKNTCLIDTTADNVHSRLYFTGHGFTCQRRSIKSRNAFDNFSVQRYTLSGFYNDCISNFYLVRVYLDQFSVSLYIGIIRSDIHKACNGFPGLGHGIRLEPFPYLIKQHNSHAF